MNAYPNLPVELEQHGTFLRDLARSLIGDPGLADDLSQEAWMARLRSSQRGGAPTDPVETRRWLSTVLRRGASNVRRSGARRSARESAVARPEAVSSSSDVAARMEIAETLLRLVRQLDEPARTAIIARFYEGLTFEEIGAREACPTSTARSRVGRGLADLRQQLDREPSGGREAWLAAVTALAVPPRSAAMAGAAGVTTTAGWIAAALLVVTTGAGVALWRSFAEPQAERGAKPSPTMAVTMQSAEAGLTPSVALAGVPAAERGQQEGRAAIEIAPAEPILSGDGVVWQLLGSGEREPAVGAVVTWEELDQAPPSPRLDHLRLEAPGLAAMGYGGGPDARVSATCRADGTYEWPDGKKPDTREARLVIEVAEDDVYAAVRWEGTAEEWSSLRRPMELLRLPHGTFSGRVVDLEGHAMEGVQLIGTRPGGSVCPTTLSDERGSFSVPYLGSDGSILAEKTGWVMCSDDSLAKLPRSAGSVPSVVMARAGTVRIHVGDQEHTPEFAAAIVSASEPLRRPTFRDLYRLDRKVGDDRVAVLEGLPVGQRLVVVTSFDRVYSHMVGEDLVLEPESDDDILPAGAVPIVIPEGGSLELRLGQSRYWSIDGEVVDREGQPVPDALVVLGARWLETSGGRSMVEGTRTDEQGRFTLRWLVTGELKPYLLLTAISEEGEKAQLESLMPAQVRSGERLRLVLEGPIQVKGTLRVPEGDPADARVYVTLLAPPSLDPADAHVALEQMRPAVRPDGTFEFQGLRNGQYEVLAKHPGFGSETLLRASASSGPLEITLDRPRTTTVKLGLDFGAYGEADRTDLLVSSIQGPLSASATGLAFGRTRHQVDLRDGVVEILLAPGRHTIEVRATLKGGRRLVTLPFDLQLGAKDVERRVALAPELDAPQYVELNPAEQTGDLWLTAHEPGSVKALEVGRTASDRTTRFLQVDGRGAFRFRGPAGTYDVRVGSRNELMKGKGRLIPGMSIED